MEKSFKRTILSNIVNCIFNGDINDSQIEKRKKEIKSEKKMKKIGKKREEKTKKSINREKWNDVTITFH